MVSALPCIRVHLDPGQRLLSKHCARLVGHKVRAPVLQIANKSAGISMSPAPINVSVTVLEPEQSDPEDHSQFFTHSASFLDFWNI